MPTVLKLKEYRFHFYSNEGIEPAHIHCRKDNSEYKFWLENISLSDNNGFRPHEIREIEKIVYDNKNLFLEAFYEYHNRK